MTGPQILARYFIPSMIANGWRRFVNVITSFETIWERDELSSKAALKDFTYVRRRSRSQRCARPDPLAHVNELQWRDASALGRAHLECFRSRPTLQRARRLTKPHRESASEQKLNREGE